MVREEGIDTVEDYLKIIKLNKDLKANKGDSEDFLFRGQKGDHPLIPKIGQKGIFLTLSACFCKSLTNQPFADSRPAAA
jgi:hypothetical protein